MIGSVLIAKESLIKNDPSIVNNLDYLNALDVKMVQETIDNAAGLGNINPSFSAGSLLDLQFLQRA